MTSTSLRDQREDADHIGLPPINESKTPDKRPAVSDPDTDSYISKTLKTTENAKGKKKMDNAANDGKKADNKAKPARSAKAPRVPTDRTHFTEMYQRYDPLVDQQLSIPDFKPRNFSFDAFNSCPLYMELTTSGATNQPRWSAPDGVRLDDYNCAEALLNLSPADMHKRFPAEFDAKGMLRATRNPLGYARKFFVTAGMSDGDGDVAGKGAVGYYYAWFKGLQPLMGKEGYAAGRYMVRPSNERIKTPELTWFLHSKCVVQYRQDIQQTPPLSLEHLKQP